LPPLAEPKDGAWAQYQAEHQLLRLLQWPDMRAVPPRDLLDTARVCAMLARRPMLAYLVPLRLNLPSERVALVLQLLAQGVLAPVGEPAAAAPQAPIESASGDAKKGSVWNKLLRRLLN
jgi:hypothetical protein